MFKRLLAMALLASLLLGMTTTAFATDDTSVSNPPLVITEEYIAEHGIPSTDEFGNDTILIPLGPSTSGGIALPEPPEDDHDYFSVHEEHFPENSFITPYHFSLKTHTHKIINLKQGTFSGTVPVTAYAAPGFTVTKHYDETFTISASLELAGGISKSDVEGTLGIQVGGSYTWGSGESYEATVPSGWRGRISYRYYSYMYVFDNETTYFTLPTASTPPIVTKVTVDPCSAISKPYDGFYYLELREFP